MIDRPHGIMFHHFHDQVKHPIGQGSITGKEFQNILLWLQKDYTILSAKEWYEKAIQHTLESKDICITFDDNLLCQYEIALPVLEALNIQAFWFVYSSPLTGIKEKLEIYRYFRSVAFKDFDHFYQTFFNTITASPSLQKEVEAKLAALDTNEYLKKFPFYTTEDKIFRYTRDQILGQQRYFEVMDDMINRHGLDIEKISATLWNNASQLKYLHDTGHIIGLHSHTHPTELKKMSYKDQLAEYKKNREILVSILGQEINCMSHPCNSYNDDTLTILKDMNVQLGFRANPEPGYDSPLEYPRIDHALLIDKAK